MLARRARVRRRDRLAVLRGRRRRLHRARPTGLFVYGGDKARAIEQLAERDGLDLAASYAYSDSASDLPMLRLVGHPVAVNPDAALARVAREEGWEVLRFDRLGRRLKAAVGLAGAAVAGGVGSAAVAAHNRRRRAAGGQAAVSCASTAPRLRPYGRHAITRLGRR